MKIYNVLKNLLLFILDNSAAFIDFARSYANMRAAAFQADRYVQSKMDIGTSNRFLPNLGVHRNG